MKKTSVYCRQIPIKFMNVFVLLSALLPMPSCVVRPFKSANNNINVTQLAASGSPVALPLISESSLDLLEKDISDLQRSKALIVLPNQKELLVSGNLWNNLSYQISLGNEVERSENNNGFTRFDVFKLTANMSASKVVNKGKSLALPYGFTAGSEIQYARHFSNETAAAAAAPLPNILDLPINSQKALLLKTNDYVSIPISTSLFANLSGTAVQRAAQKIAEIRSLAKGTLSGALSASVEAKAAFNGQFNYQILKTSPTKVRVRVAKQGMKSISGGITLQTREKGALRLFPYADLEKIKSLLKLKKLKKAESLKDFADTSAVVSRLVLPATFDVLAKAPKVNFEELSQEVISAGVKSTTDFALAIDSLNLTIDEINNKVIERVNKNLTVLLDRSLGKIEHSTAFLLDTTAEADLDGEFLKETEVLGDFEYDLAQPMGALAYDRLLSGRVVFLSADKVTFDGKKEFVSDLSFSSEIADEQFGENNPAVLRFAEASRTDNNKGFSLAFSVLNTKRAFLEKWRETRLDLTSHEGKRQTFRVKQWSFANNLQIGDNSNNEKRLSAMIFADSDTTQNSLEWYLYNWQVSKPTQTTDAYNTSFYHLMNVMGSFSFALDLVRWHKGNYLGSTKSNLQIAFGRAALDSFFDTKTTTEQILWNAFGKLAGWHNYDNSLPYLADPFAHTKLDAEFKSVACEGVQNNLGGGYCGYFAGQFLPQWYKAAAAIQDMRRAEFLERFHSDGLLANKFGADFLARFIIEVLFAKHGKDAVNLISMDFSLQNQTDASLQANPRVTWGDNPYLRLSTLLWQDLI